MQQRASLPSDAVVAEDTATATKKTNRKGSAFAPRKKRESAARNKDFLAEAATPLRDAVAETSWTAMAIFRTPVTSPVVQAEAAYNRKRKGRPKGHTKFDTRKRLANEADPDGSKRQEKKTNFFAHHYAGKRRVFGKERSSTVITTRRLKKKKKYDMGSLLKENHE